MSDAETPVSVPDQADSVTAAPEAPQAKPRRRRRTKAEMDEPDDQIKVVATGGLARLIASHTPLIDVVDSQLILDGLLCLYQRWKQQQA